MLNLITAINSLEMNGNAPHTVEALVKIYEEMYGRRQDENMVQSS